MCVIVCVHVWVVICGLWAIWAVCEYVIVSIYVCLWDACVIMWGDMICDCVYVYHCACWRAMKLLLSLVDWNLRWAQPHLLAPAPMGVAGPGRGGDPVAAHDASRAMEHIPLVISSRRSYDAPLRWEDAGNAFWPQPCLFGGKN